MRPATGSCNALTPRLIFVTDYLTLGTYDMVVVSEAPNDAAYATTMLAISAAGAVRSETLKAFTEEEYRGIIAALP